MFTKLSYTAKSVNNIKISAEQCCICYSFINTGLYRANRESDQLGPHCLISGTEPTDLCSWTHNQEKNINLCDLWEGVTFGKLREQWTTESSRKDKRSHLVGWETSRQARPSPKPCSRIFRTVLGLFFLFFSENETFFSNSQHFLMNKQIDRRF